MILPNQSAPIPRIGTVHMGLAPEVGIAPAGARPAKFWAKCPAANTHMLISKKKPEGDNAQKLKTKFKCNAATGGEDGWIAVYDPVEGVRKVKDPKKIKLVPFDLDRFKP